MTGPGSWGNHLIAQRKDPAKFNSLQLIVPMQKAASGTKEFDSVPLRPLIGKNTEYKHETRPAEAKKKGSGSVTVDDKGATAKVSFNVTSGEGYKFEGTIDCKSIMAAAASPPNRVPLSARTMLAVSWSVGL
ncbi:hypothetical protein [Candidatus Aalborgicola defluviihabitans]|uniref:hypothetical protein n=1 Tax=Candidatus Aalborgicola defluviihabitans TaxID=3386187 RepID=UPI001EC5F53F|nr:hypothetical protein [Burkholderiales bacterium]